MALKDFEQAISDNPAVEANCHPIAHRIGAGALLHFHSDVGRAFADGTAACGSGYYHGLLEWKLADAAPDEVAGVATAVCADERIRAHPFTHYQCVHGLGHGLMLYSKYDLPHALDLCHELPVEFDAVSCTGGVFMENQQTSYGAKSKWLKDDDLLYPCSIVEKADKLYCYLLVTSYILPKVDGDWSETAPLVPQVRDGVHPDLLPVDGPRRLRASRGRSRRRSTASAPPPATCGASASSAPPATS